jgi:hypothetical protein
MATFNIPPTGGVALSGGTANTYNFAGSVAHWYEVSCGFTAGFGNLSFDGDPGSGVLRIRSAQPFKMRVKTKSITMDPGSATGWMSWTKQ